MAPEERTQLGTRLRADATRMQTVLEQAITATAREAAPLEARGPITDDAPTPTPVSLLEEEYDAWERMAPALSDMQTELMRMAQAEQHSRQRSTAGEWPCQAGGGGYQSTCALWRLGHGRVPRERDGARCRYRPTGHDRLWGGRQVSLLYL